MLIRAMSSSRVLWSRKGPSCICALCRIYPRIYRGLARVAFLILRMENGYRTLRPRALLPAGNRFRNPRQAKVGIAVTFMLRLPSIRRKSFDGLYGLDCTVDGTEADCIVNPRRTYSIKFQFAPTVGNLYGSLGARNDTWLSQNAAIRHVFGPGGYACFGNY